MSILNKKYRGWEWGKLSHLLVYFLWLHSLLFVKSIIFRLLQETCENMVLGFLGAIFFLTEGCIDFAGPM